MTEPTATPLAAISSLHHTAFRCRDAEQTRWFYEDVLGLELEAGLVFNEEPGTGRPVDYMHLFFIMPDGNFIAFFDAPDSAKPEMFEKKWSFDVHFAFEVPSREDLLAWQQRINDKGVTCLGPVDHDFIESVYMYDPNGYQVEITCRTPRYEQVLAEEKAGVREQMKQWTAKTRALKEERFGAEVLDKRGRVKA